MCEMEHTYANLQLTGTLKIDQRTMQLCVCVCGFFLYHRSQKTKQKPSAGN